MRLESWLRERERENLVLCLRYEHGPIAGYLDLPGGKIEDGESEKDACIRELKEETGLSVFAEDLHYIGKVVNDTPNCIFDLQIYVADQVTGELCNSEGDTALWQTIDTVISSEKRLPIIRLLDSSLIKLLKIPGFEVEFISDANQNIISQQIVRHPEP